MGQENKRIRKPELGVITSLTADNDPFTHVAQFGLFTCHLCNWDPNVWTKKRAEEIKQLSCDSGVRIAAVWAGYSGPKVWNFLEGPTTLGLVPPKYRKTRVKELQRAAEFAAMVGAPAIITHAGFIPETPSDRLYAPTIEALRKIAETCLNVGVDFWFETGQETPITLLRTIEDIGLNNLGINLDTANCILYGKANPVDSLDVFGKYVKNLHAKDGFYPTSGRPELAKEAPIGKGKVDWVALFAKLKKLRFLGDVIIEREISGPQQAKDIRKAVRFLQEVIDKTYS
ncbi:MAG TPA: sugar phosphate isomerase/epimerase family protein [Candidatus Hydrogenedentes bacterium]|nr:sugar phosphate isomerase/epimerase family protein [Candidatus Hydrogenedentota bacterium]HOL75655.1 sugar phosphate isomerase/epimerase family protein [Candidatus Hydrogenedentota bacterium]HPO84352.1 sugar phosphate isomerase/epimerase family protein [Candidatus Hydrogenedentota bacterium]